MSARDFPIPMPTRYDAAVLELRGQIKAIVRPRTYTLDDVTLTECRGRFAPGTHVIAHTIDYPTAIKGEVIFVGRVMKHDWCPSYIVRGFNEDKPSYRFREGLLSVYTAPKLRLVPPPEVIDANRMNRYIASFRAIDWAYQYSDDSRVFNANAKLVDALRAEQQIVDPKAVIWNAHPKARGVKA